MKAVQTILIALISAVTWLLTVHLMGDIALILIVPIMLIVFMVTT